MSYVNYATQAEITRMNRKVKVKSKYVEIRLRILNCSECPDIKMRQLHTGDSWEHVDVWSCRAKHNKRIGESESPSDLPPVPDWCPRRVDARSAQ